MNQQQELYKMLTVPIIEDLFIELFLVIILEIRNSSDEPCVWHRFAAISVHVTCSGAVIGWSCLFVDRLGSNKLQTSNRHVLGYYRAPVCVSRSRW